MVGRRRYNRNSPGKGQRESEFGFVCRPQLPLVRTLLPGCFICAVCLFVSLLYIPEGWRKVAASRRFFPKEPPAEPEPGWTLVKG